MKKKIIALMGMAVISCALLMGCGSKAETPAAETTTEAESSDEETAKTEETAEPEKADSEEAAAVTLEDGVYTAKEDVALYLMLYGHLPSNFITKSDAQALGWDSRQGNLWDVAPGMSIGGDVFGNREGLLPKTKGRTYYECDIDYEGGYRGSKRIVYSNDGLIYYTEDHYQTFECLSE